MAKFQITAPDGSQYEIEGENEQGAMQALHAHLGSQPPSQPDAGVNDGSVGPSFARGGTAMPEKPMFGGTDAGRSFGQGVANTVMFGFNDEAAAGLASLRAKLPGGNGKSYSDILDMIRKQDKADAEAHPVANVGGMLAGGLAGGLGLAKSGLSLTARAANAGQGLLRTAGASAIEGGLLGAGQGFGNGEGGFLDRTINAGKGAAMGGVLGGAVPLGLAAGGAAIKPLIAPFAARSNPEKYAELALGAGLRRSGTTPEKVSNALQSAADDGQGVFNIADAMGLSGQRLLSTVARTPNDARQEVVGDLLRRQTGQGTRLSNTLAEGFGAPDTAAQRVASLTTARDRAADLNYMKARLNAGPVDLQPSIGFVDDYISPGVQKLVSPADAIAPDGIENVLSGYRARMTDGNSVLTDFDRSLTLKKDVSDAVTKAERSGEGNRARVLGMLNKQLDSALEEASSAYRSANDTFKTQSGVIDAVDTGTQAASGRARAADNIANFNAMTPDQQGAFRPGYADPWIAKVEAATQLPTTNKARMLISDKTRQEFPAFAVPGEGSKISRRIGREQRMFETLNSAVGGSKTADNMADMADMAQFDPAIFHNLLKGDWKQAAFTAAMRGMNEVKGLPPSVVERVGRTLMQSDPQAALNVLNNAANRGQVSAKNRAMVATMLNNLGGASAGRLGAP